MRRVLGHLLEHLQRIVRLPFAHRELALRDHDADFLRRPFKLHRRRVDDFLRLARAVEFRQNLRVHHVHGRSVARADGYRVLPPRALLLRFGHRFLHARELHRGFDLLQPALVVLVQHHALRGDDRVHRRVANREIRRDGFVELALRVHVIPVRERNLREHDVRVRDAVGLRLYERVRGPSRRVVVPGDVPRPHEKQPRRREPGRARAHGFEQRQRLLDAR
eukprot:31311-Pelagococcus_subviridis.AAC.4